MELKELVKEAFSKGTFEDILNSALDQNLISSMDIIHASDIYMNPDIPPSIERMELEDIIKYLLNMHSVEEIIEEFDLDEVMDCIDEDDMIDHLDGSWEMNRRDEQNFNDGYKQGHKDCTEEHDDEFKDIVASIQEYNSDQLHEFICNYFNISYYDFNELKKKIDYIKTVLNKNSYGFKYES